MLQGIWSFMFGILKSASKHGGGGGPTDGSGTWPLGFGIIDVALPAVGVLLLVGMVVGFIVLLIAMKKKGDKANTEILEEETH